MDNLVQILFLILFIYPFSFCHGLVEIYQATEPVEHSEGPVWDERKQILYFVDISGGSINAYHYKTTNTTSILTNGPVSVIIPSIHDPDLLVAGIGRQLVTVKWDGGKNVGPYNVLSNVSKQFPKSRFNDGKADVNGQLWIGTIGFEDEQGVRPNEGIFYHFNKTNFSKPQVAIAPVNVSNGLAWTKDNTKFYYIDTPTRKVVQYDFNKKTETISNKRVAFDFENYSFLNGFPDGMTIDEDDNLWVAVWSGAAIIKVNPRNGRLLEVIPMPAKYISSVMWGGPHYDILFVTSSRRDLSEQEKKTQPLAGSVFALKGLNTKGRPAYFADV